MDLRHILVAFIIAAEASLAGISYTPITTGATESAQKLYNFLATNYGTKTVSGVQTGELSFSDDLTSQPDLLAVDTVSGKYPALVGFDFLFATGINASTSWYQQYTNKTLSLAIELWNAGGIPAFSWHWKDPSDSVDEFYVEGANDTYTTFDFTNAFKSGTTDWDSTSETFTQITSDIDEIAAYFQTLQDSGVAAIFRPLHECGGTWFWWNDQTAEQYAALYRLVYTRMTETDGIKNLVWVWNPQKSIFTKADWNPGSDYYDIISVDIYNNANNNKSNSSVFESMGTNYGTDKIFALSENGPIPDVSLMHTDSAVWSWWMPWYESWSGGFVSKTADSVWTSNMADDRIITLDKMPGWDKYIVGIEKDAEIRPILSSRVEENNILISLPTSGTANIAIFNIQGNQVTSLNKGNIDAGTHSFTLTGLSRGYYVLRATGSFGSLVLPLQIRE
ncbi:MAG TPA: glycosyl hydrolase [Fibrobacteraceae bacterium]|nr:glycosyl hydrolase [Fibrobacteraceae bacterium]